MEPKEETMEEKDEVRVYQISGVVNYEINKAMSTLLDVVELTNKPEFNRHMHRADNITKLTFVKAAVDLILQKINQTEQTEVRSGIEVTE